MAKGDIDARFEYTSSGSGQTAKNAGRVEKSTHGEIEQRINAGAGMPSADPAVGKHHARPRQRWEDDG